MTTTTRMRRPQDEDECDSNKRKRRGATDEKEIRSSETRQKYEGREYRGNQLSCGMVVLIVLLRIPSFFIWQKLWDLGFRTSSAGNARYVDYNTNPVARQQEMGAAPSSAGAGAFSQPPRATPPAPRPTPPAPVSAPAPVSPAPVSVPAPVSAPAPPAPITSPAVVSFTPSSPASGPSATYQ